MAKESLVYKKIYLAILRHCSTITIENRSYSFDEVLKKKIDDYKIIIQVGTLILILVSSISGAKLPVHISFIVLIVDIIVYSLFYQWVRRKFPKNISAHLIDEE